MNLLMKEMEKYKATGDVGVSAFEIIDKGIILEFKDGSTYLYNYIKPGKAAVEQMKRLAIEGRGLTTFVNQHVRSNYKEKLK